MKKLLMSTGVVLALGAAAVLIAEFVKADQPIDVGDGSITLHHAGKIKKNSDTEVEADDFLHKVKSIAISNYGQSPTQTIDVTNRAWSLSSNSTLDFQLSLRSHSLGFEDGVPAYCSSRWSGSGSDYTCTPTGGTKLTPVTITFSDGNCPDTAMPSCTLSCSTGRCLLRLEYK